jgi:hypothetical protein
VPSASVASRPRVVVTQTLTPLCPVSRLNSDPALTTATSPVTKQAASQLVEQLVRRGYVERITNPHDGRSQWLALTVRGWACTRAAEQAAADASTAWEKQLGAAAFAELQRSLGTIVQPGPLRPSW